jgi:hypothetical protein
MQLDFTKPIENPTGISGWLEKKESLRKNWKSRYFYLKNGVLKYYGKGPNGTTEGGPVGGEGVDWKGDIFLVNADVCIFEETQVHLTIRGEKKSIHYLKSSTNEEASQWYHAIAKEIQYQNIQALHQGSRSPDIIEWYYQYQSELYRRHNFLSKSAEVTLHLYSPFRGEVEGDDNPALFYVAMTDDRSGLLLSTIAGSRKGFNRLESIHNGRLISWQDITGAELSPAGWVLDPVTNHFYFTLVTKEDELFMEMEAYGVPWLQAVQEMVTFMQIPKPAARTMSVNMTADRTQANNMNNLMEFSANSGVIFTCSSDVPLLIEGFNSLATRFPLLLEVGQRLNSVLKLIPELKVNKEAALNFGERLEEVIRMLGDQEVGVLYNTGDNDRTLVNFHLSTLNNKLNEIIKYFYTQSRAGWLGLNLSSRTQDSAKFKYNSFDLDMITIPNTLIKALNLTELSPFPKKDYAMAVDVRKSIEALGGIQIIYNDAAKERALARLIQADGSDVHSELKDFLNRIQTGNISLNPTTSTTGYSLTGWRTSFDGTTNRPSFSGTVNTLTGTAQVQYNKNTTSADHGRTDVIGTSFSSEVSDASSSSWSRFCRWLFCCGCCCGSSRHSVDAQVVNSTGKISMRPQQKRGGSLNEPLVKNQRM